MKFVIITGMPGAGKSEVARILHEEFKIPLIVMGDVIRSEVRSRGLEPTPLNTRKIMLELREMDGLGAVAKRCIPHINTLDAAEVVIEGCRSLAEVDVFKEFSDTVTIVCVHSAPMTRFTRLQSRGRKDSPPDFETFRERDMREISVGLGGVIALADIMIVNEGSLDSLQENIRRAARRLV
ncbi:MAG: AAA family ATPase [Candidatus Thorarchaeota archaeon]|nr:AAA family ATPase [Candidatus Thorarchaeota archaeon]